VASESDFDELAAAAADVADARTAAVVLLSGDGPWLRGRTAITPGDEGPHLEIGKQVAAEGTEIEWTQPPAGAGFPLRMSSGEMVGALTVMTPAPRSLDDVQRRMLRVLARQVVSQLEMRHRAAADLAQLQAERDLSAALLGALHDGYAYLERGCIVTVNDAFCAMTGMSRAQLIGRSTPFSFLTEPGNGATHLRKMINDKSGHVELRIQRPDGTRIEVGIQVHPVRRADRRVSGYVALLRDITDRKQQEQRLRHRADHDGLTGLLNRGAFHACLAERVAAAHAGDAPLCLAMLDLDCFKAVNDMFGHSAGDAVLVEFADRLRGNARGDDAIGRLGGEEFGWIMGDVDLDEALASLTRTLDAVRRHPFPHGGQLTFSGGVAQLRAEAAGALMQRADTLLYTAKAAGRERVIAEPPPGMVPAQGRLA
jgi:diguanylate cyclase (GGDEF)-like protein/PAS domain S-box-containing protein